MKRRFVAILAADVSGYSRLVAQDEEGTLARLLADRRVFDVLARREAGRVFNTAGDAILAEFATAADAVRAAVAIQGEIHRRNAPEAEARRMRYRIGLTMGDVVDQDGDLLGDGVNVASRLEALAEPGGICLSRSVREQAGAALPVPARSIGAQRLKNMPQPVHAYLIAPDALCAGSGRRPRRAGLRAAAVAAAVFVAVGGSVAVLARRFPDPVRRVDAAEVGGQARGMVFGPDAEPPAPLQPAPRRPFEVDATPFVGDAGRARIASELAKGAHHAVAMANHGTFGVAAGAGDPEGAEKAALRGCFDARGQNCRLFEVDGDVVWPTPHPPMPPEPWVDAGAPRTPFDANSIAGLTPNGRRLAPAYAAAKGAKAFALGPLGIWAYRSGKASVEEAERLALEFCGEDAGSPCRIVAVGDDFVVPLRAPQIR